MIAKAGRYISSAVCCSSVLTVDVEESGDETFKSPLLVAMEPPYKEHVS